jgi:hypothetical protein
VTPLTDLSDAIEPTAVLVIHNQGNIPMRTDGDAVPARALVVLKDYVAAGINGKAVILVLDNWFCEISITHIRPVEGITHRSS